jgi:hypothetical protein
MKPQFGDRILMASQLFLSQMNHWALFPVLLLSIGISGEERTLIGSWSFLGLFPFVLVLIRRKINRFLPFMGLHLLTGTLFWISMPWSGISAVILRIVIIVYLLMSFALRVREGDRLSPPLPPPVAVGITAFALLVQPFITVKPAEDIAYTLSISIYFLCYFVWIYLVHYLHFLKVNNSSAGYLPAKEIFRSGVGAAGIYAIIGACILMLTGGINWLSNLLRPLGHLMILFLRYVFSLMGDAGEPAPAEGVSQPPGNGMPDIEPGTPFWLWEVLGQIVLWALMIATVIFLIKGLVWLIRMLYRRFMSRLRPEQEGTSEGIRDIREKCETQRQTVTGTGWWTALRPEERIRRWYKKLLIAGSKKLPPDPKPEVHTTKDWGRSLQLSGFTDIYEKARYAEHECTTEDIKIWREIAKNLTKVQSIPR